MSGWLNRWHARRAAKMRPPTGFLSQPEPRTIGRLAKGQQLVTGQVLLAGHLVDLDERSVWDVPPPSTRFTQELHGFGWMDDLAALGDRSARDTAMTREGRMVVDPETGTTATASLRKTVRVGSLSVAEETILRRHP